MTVQRAFGRRAFSLSLSLSLITGCLGPGGIAAIPVMGRVTVSGSDWKNGGSVLFQSDGASETAALDAEGRFALRLPPGAYRVAIEPAGGIPVEKPDPKKGGILPKYMAPSTSGITVSIDDEHREFVIELEGM